MPTRFRFHFTTDCGLTSLSARRLRRELSPYITHCGRSEILNVNPLVTGDKCGAPTEWVVPSVTDQGNIGWVEFCSEHLKEHLERRELDPHWVHKTNRAADELFSAPDKSPNPSSDLPN
jgi:hypothetical protein